MECRENVRFGSVMKTIFRMFRLGMPKFLLCIGGVTLAGLGGYLMQLLVGMIMSVTMRHYETSTSAVPDILLLLAVLAAFLPLTVMGYHLTLRGGLGIRASIQKKLLSAWMRQTESFAARHHSGEAMALLTSDMQIMENFYYQGLMFTFFVPLVQGFAAAVTIAFVNIWLVVIPVIFGLFALLAAVYMGGKIHKRNMHLRKATDASVSHFSDLLGGNTAHRFWGTTNKKLEGYERVSDDLAQDGVSAKNLDVHLTSYSTLLSSLSVVAFFAVGIIQIQAGQIGYAGLLLAFPLQDSVFGMVKCLGDTWRFLITSSVSGDRVIAALNCPKEERGEGNCPLEKDGSGLVFKDVSFGYQDEDPIVQNISFTVQRGQTVALVGKSGCGKSTLLKLLMKFYDPDSGVIALSGVDSAACFPGEWRARLTCLEQSAPLLRRTVFENIAMGRYGDGVEPTMEDVISAAKAAGAHEFIMALPNGYDTLLDESGENLSGGQRQRIAIARAFLADTELLLLDEPTASLDTESQQVVWQSLQKLIRKKTALIISHNLESLKRCDRILVLEDGRIVESGTHAELLKTGGEYAKLYSNQFQQ